MRILEIESGNIMGHVTAFKIRIGPNIRIMKEIWKPIKGFEGHYEISSLGGVKSIKNGNHKMMNPSIGIMGYRIVKLRMPGWIKKDIRIHRLVAMHFIVNPENKPTVNHIDGNKLNNDVNNLEWATHKENSSHAVKTKLLDTKGSKHKHSKLVESQVIEMRKLYDSGNYTHKKLAEIYGLGRRHVGDIINRVCWKHV